MFARRALPFGSLVTLGSVVRFRTRSDNCSNFSCEFLFLRFLFRGILYLLLFLRIQISICTRVAVAWILTHMSVVPRLDQVSDLIHRAPPLIERPISSDLQLQKIPLTGGVQVSLLIAL